MLFVENFGGNIARYLLLRLDQMHLALGTDSVFFLLASYLPRDMEPVSVILSWFILQKSTSNASPVGFSAGS
jgi:hypothetical protein